MLSVVKGVWKTIQIVFIAIVGMIFVFNLWIGFSRIVLGNEYPTFFGCSVTAVVSNSMYPTFEKGDLIVVKSQKSYEVGDMISFKDEIGVCTHRIVEKTENGYVTWGDNREINNADDGEVLAENVYGKVVNILPNLGTTVQFLKTPVGLICTSLLLILAIVVPIIFDKIRESDLEEKGLSKVSDKLVH